MKGEEREDRGIRKEERKTRSAVLVCENDTRTLIAERKRKHTQLSKQVFYVRRRLKSTHTYKYLYCYKVLLSLLWQKNLYFFTSGHEVFLSVCTHFSPHLLLLSCEVLRRLQHTLVGCVLAHLFPNVLQLTVRFNKKSKIFHIGLAYSI